VPISLSLLCALSALVPQTVPVDAPAPSLRGGLMVAQLQPAHDNSMYSNSGALSNGAGIYLFSGATQDGSIRRCLIRFDTSAIPPGAYIEDAQLTLTISRAVASGNPMSLYRLVADWGEAGSDAGDPGGLGAPAQPGDATWTYSFYNTVNWANAGGDYTPLPSASSIVGMSGTAVWAGPQLIADVQAWVNGTTPNFGWILVGDEQSSGSAKRFDSREHPTSANRPTLTVTYTTTVAVEPTTWGSTKASYR
jgi:hypothetical protein